MTDSSHYPATGLIRIIDPAKEPKPLTDIAPDALDDEQRAEAERKAQLRLRTRMIATGFHDPSKAERWLNAPELKHVSQDALFAGLRLAPSPDIALPALVRLIERSPNAPTAATKNSACTACSAHPRRLAIFSTAAPNTLTRSSTRRCTRLRAR